MPPPPRGKLPCAFLLLAAVLALPACDRDPGPVVGDGRPLLDVPQQVVFQGPLLAVPGPRWDRHPPEDGRWRFRAFGRILFLLRQAGSGPLVFDLLADDRTSGYDFEISWDGEKLDPASIRRLGRRLRIEIPVAGLSAGRHELTLVRRRRYRARPKEGADNLFDELRYRYGGRETVLAPGSIPRQRLIAELLQHGVMGSAQERRDGLLFVGPQRHRLAPGPTAGDAPGRYRAQRFHVEPENFSNRRAVFRLRSGDRRPQTSVEPGERGRLVLELDGDGAAAGEIVLEVEGEADGLYLWGMPLLEDRSAGEELTPVVLVTLDTTRRDALGAYSGRREVTPAIDRLAARATVFEQAFSTSPWTLPSHASIFTGLYPSKHAAGVSRAQLPAGTATLAGLLRHRGYLTAGFSAGELSSSRFGLAQGFHQYRNPDKFETPGGRVAEYVDAFLDRHGWRPLFLFVNYFDPHAVYRAPPKFAQRLGVAAREAEVRGLPVWGQLVAGEMSSWRRAVEGEAPITPEVMEYLESAYLAEVAYADHLVGRLLDRLQQLGLYDRALIVVTADHGELLGEGGYVSHAARLDPELVEIPLIVKWPGQTEGARDDRLVSLVDLFPTILAAAGVEPPPSDGRSLRGSEDRRSFVLLEEHEFLVHPLPKYMKIASHLFGVQRPGFRQLVWDEGERCARRRAGAWQDVTCAAERQRVLESIRAELGAGAEGAEAEGEMSEEVRQSLEALGYL